MFSQIIEEALAQEKEAEELITRAKNEASKNENEATLKAGVLIKEAQSKAIALTNKAIEATKAEEMVLDSQNQEKISALKNNLLLQYNNPIEQAAQEGFVLLTASSVSV